MLDVNTERPDLNERYECATSASRLLLEEHRTGAVDVIIAAGWSPTRIGMALLRLHSEWTAAAKPRKPTKESIEALAAAIRAEDAQERGNRHRANGELARLLDLQAKFPDFDRAVEIMQQRRLYESGDLPMPELKQGNVQDRAKAEADRWYANELRILATGLKSRGTVWDQIAPWAEVKGIPSDLVAEALQHWLAPTCPHCDGLGLHKVRNQPALSGRQCMKCHGTGHKPHPHGAAKMLAFMDDCCENARKSLKQRLRHR